MGICQTTGAEVSGTGHTTSSGGATSQKSIRSSGGPAESAEDKRARMLAAAEQRQKLHGSRGKGLSKSKKQGSAVGLGQGELKVILLFHRP